MYPKNTLFSFIIHFPYLYSVRLGFKGKTMEGKGGPKCSTHGRQDKENKRRALFESCLQNQKQTNGDEKQSSNQERDKVAKQKQQDKVQIKNQSSTQNMENSKTKTYQTGQEHGTGA